MCLAPEADRGSVTRSKLARTRRFGFTILILRSSLLRLTEPRSVPSGEVADRHRQVACATRYGGGGMFPRFFSM